MMPNDSEFHISLALRGAMIAKSALEMLGNMSPRMARLHVEDLGRQLAELKEYLKDK
jgi:hypothetical protein